MNNWKKKLQQFWFEEVPAERLALLRIFTGLYALSFLGRRVNYLYFIAQTDPVMYSPKSIIRLIPTPLNPEFFLGLVIVALILNIAYILGWKFKFSGVAFAFIFWFVLSYRNSWSMMYHTHHLVVLMIGVLGISRSADALSVDANRLKGPSNSEFGGLHWQYGWPIKLICSLILIAYFLAAVAKLAGELHWNWIFSLRDHVAVDALRKEVLGAKNSAFFSKIYVHNWFFVGGAAVSLLLELLAPLAILSRRAGKIWAVMTFLMHWFILLIMSITFLFQLSGIPFLAFFEPERWLKKLTGKKKDLSV